MTGGTIDHAVIMRNLHRALDTRLRGNRCQPLGPDAGVNTVGSAIRYPDALVTCSKLTGKAMTVPNPIVVFEIISPTSGERDRVVKAREYAAVASIRRYVIIESASVGLTVFQRDNSGDDWRDAKPTDEQTLRMPEIGIEIPVSEIYEDVEFSSTSVPGE